MFDAGVLASVIAGMGAAGIAGFACVAALLDEDHPEAEHPPLSAPADRGIASGNVTGADQDRENLASDGEIDEEDAMSVLTANSLYDTGELDSTDCPQPDLDADDPDSMNVFLHTVTDCLDETWSGQFEKDLGSFEPPVRTYWSAPGQSPCGSFPVEETAAFYCQANHGLYLGLEDIVVNSGDSDQWEPYAMLLSHEYGHHVQSEAGILNGYRFVRSQESGVTDGDTWTRRSELQANCFGGAFLGSVRDSFPVEERARDNILADAEARADTEDTQRRTHGTPENGVLWTHHGFDRIDPAACNTWDARDGLVE